MQRHYGLWSRERLWALYWGYVTYLFLHNAWIAIGVAYVFEAYHAAVFFITKMHPAHTLWHIQLRNELMWRTAAVFVGVFAGVFVSYVMDLTRIEGMRALSYAMLGAVFASLRQMAAVHADWYIPVAHVIMFVAMGDAVFFAEPWTYGAFALYGSACLASLLITRWIGMYALLTHVLALVLVLFFTYITSTGRRRLPLWDYYIVDN